MIDWARASLAAVIRGNHDPRVHDLDTLDEFTDLAQTSALWTMEHLTVANRTYLRVGLAAGALLVNHALVLVHGSPRDEDEYVTNMKQVADVFSFLAGHLESDVSGLPFFFGHTHMQGLYLRTEGRTRGISPPLAPMPEVSVGLEKGAAYLINTGSVGQPRDGDPRAAYAIFDSETREVALRRVPIITWPQRARIAAAGLPHKLGTRLALGR